MTRQSIYFNPRTREGATICLCCVCRRSGYFNPRTREGATGSRNHARGWPPNFNPRTREGATISRLLYGWPCGYFNPRTREGATWYNQYNATCDYSISIHAPVKVRQLHGIGHQATRQISIHAPVKVRPHEQSDSRRKINHFNPRTREDATISRIIVLPPITYFNPRTREGATLDFPRDFPRRANFNPRTREGATSIASVPNNTVDISIHAPVKVRLSRRCPFRPS